MTVFRERKPSFEEVIKKPSTIIFALVGVFIFMLVLGSWYTLDERERGVVTRYGKVVDVAEPGLGFKVPLLDNVIKISVQDHVEVYKDLQAYSRDQQPATITVSVSYRLDQSKIGQLPTPKGAGLQEPQVDQTPSGN